MLKIKDHQFGTSGVLAMSLAGIWNLFMPVSMAVTADCEFHQEMVMGQQYYIYNKEYPDNYTGGVGCRWTAHSIANTKIVLSCEEVDLPKSDNCNGDRLSVSLTGDRNFGDSQNFCGKGQFTLVSKANSLTVGLFSRTTSPGGHFLCTLVAITDKNDQAQTSTTAACDCGWIQGTRIVGGQETGVNEYPSMAGLVTRDNIQLYCGGSIISDRYVLTAGHCLFNKDASNIGVLVGDHNISTGLDTPYSAFYLVNAYEIHPNFNINTLANDIGIIQTTLPIVFSLFVGPACLPFRYTTSDFYGQTVTALGWGQTEFSGSKSDTLQKVDLSVISNSECVAENPDLTESQLCTYAPGKDACQSDSGGPLLWTDTSVRRLQLIGVISFGLGCGSTRPSVNTRLTYYLSWIISLTSDAGYCIK